MPRTSALNTLIELARTRTDDAAKRLGSLNIQSMDLQAKLALLLQYGDEYRARFAVSMQRGLKASDWRNYQEFLDRLDAAIAEQREFLALMNQRLKAGQSAWQAARRTLVSYDTLAQRQVRSELARAARSEQKQTDEIVNNTAARQAASQPAK
jgi:flagellar FliJ protein